MRDDRGRRTRTKDPDEGPGYRARIAAFEARAMDVAIERQDKGESDRAVSSNDGAEQQTTEQQTTEQPDR